jgi:hypothetical protein
MIRRSSVIDDIVTGGCDLDQSHAHPPNPIHPA